MTIALSRTTPFFYDESTPPLRIIFTLSIVFLKRIKTEKTLASKFFMDKKKPLVYLLA
jgi:hypothetical protein